MHHTKGSETSATVDGRGHRAFSVYTNPNSNPDERTSTVIIGAGIIGSATAFYLSRSGKTRPDCIHLIEASAELYASASGKSGGFLAEDWFGPATSSLGALSFKLHKDLAEQHDGFKHWGYSRSTGTSLVDSGVPADAQRGEDWLRQGASRAQSAGVHAFHGINEGPAWLAKREGSQIQTIGEDGTVAQVDPLRLTQFLLRSAVASGVRLHQPARPIRVQVDPKTGKLSGIRIRHQEGSEHKIPCTRLLIAAGAWTPIVFNQLFPESKLKIPVTSLAGHSLVVRSPRWAAEHETQGCHAVFTTMRSGFSPEIFSRIGEEIYVAGLNDASIPLPDLPTDAKIDDKSIQELKAVAEHLLGTSMPSDLEITREGLCFRPVTPYGVPILDKIPDSSLGPDIETLPLPEGGVFIAAGHGPWGISHSLGTGKVMAEMLEGSKTSADVRDLRLR